MSRSCKECGAQFQPRSNGKGELTQFCSRDCARRSNGRSCAGANHARWKGGRTTSHGYVMVFAKGHSRANHKGYVREHILVAERALGKHLPAGAVVHHVNGIKDDNRPGNLVICQDQAEHMLLHAKARVVRAGGDPSTDKICGRCKQLKSKTEFNKSRRQHDGLRHMCKICQRDYEREYRAAKRLAPGPGSAL